MRAGPIQISLMRVPLPEADWQLAGSLAGLGGGRGFLCPPIPLGHLWVPDSACPAAQFFAVFDGGGTLGAEPTCFGFWTGRDLSAPQQLQPLSSHLTPRPVPTSAWVVHAHSPKPLPSMTPTNQVNLDALLPPSIQNSEGAWAGMGSSQPKGIFSAPKVRTSSSSPAQPRQQDRLFLIAQGRWHLRRGEQNQASQDAHKLEVVKPCSSSSATSPPTCHFAVTGGTDPPFQRGFRSPTSSRRATWEEG